MTTIPAKVYQTIQRNAFNLHLDGYTVREIVGGLYEVQSPKGAVYITDTERTSCTCPAFRQWGCCKHERGAKDAAFFQAGGRGA